MYDVDLDVQVADVPLQDEYGALLGYSAKFFAGLLLPKRALCHQKFALAIDDLFFIGHPVCVDDDGTWQFKHEEDAHGCSARKRRQSVSLSSMSNVNVSTDNVSSSTEFDSPALEGDGSPAQGVLWPLSCGCATGNAKAAVPVFRGGAGGFG